MFDVGKCSTFGIQFTEIELELPEVNNFDTKDLNKQPIESIYSVATALSMTTTAAATTTTAAETRIARCARHSITVAQCPLEPLREFDLYVRDVMLLRKKRI